MIEHVHHTIMQEGFKSEVDEEHITTLIVDPNDKYAGQTVVLTLSRERIIFDGEN
ncbi:hypothetical protein [Nitrososphaeria virus YSH_174770]|uniref:Uncharacterized protein n=1 Tax=Nitrososphaeria virus YSH_174770 TaxID=3071322 RepID=A0A976YF27_9CAUD|nr:hypothetical protein QKV93_gp06 [Yangshan Harbor Nitrososphaeria virus]UVF62351.1 hypothetical protein [Nitrososphaeria virus YSH_174770]